VGAGALEKAVVYYEYEKERVRKRRGVKSEKREERRVNF